LSRRPGLIPMPKNWRSLPDGCAPSCLTSMLMLYASPYAGKPQEMRRGLVCWRLVNCWSGW